MKAGEPEEEQWEQSEQLTRNEIAEAVNEAAKFLTTFEDTGRTKADVTRIYSGVQAYRLGKDGRWEPTADLQKFQPYVTKAARKAMSRCTPELLRQLRVGGIPAWICQVIKKEPEILDEQPSGGQPFFYSRTNGCRLGEWLVAALKKRGHVVNPTPSEYP